MTKEQQVESVLALDYDKLRPGLKAAIEILDSEATAKTRLGKIEEADQYRSAIMVLVLRMGNLKIVAQGKTKESGVTP